MSDRPSWAAAAWVVGSAVGASTVWVTCVMEIETRQMGLSDFEMHTCVCFGQANGRAGVVLLRGGAAVAGGGGGKAMGLSQHAMWISYLVLDKWH